MSEKNIPISEKYLLSISEAAAYFNIGEKRFRRLAEDDNHFAIINGNRYLIIRKRFEEYIDSLTERGEEDRKSRNYPKKLT